MASAEEIQEVRKNTDEPSAVTYSDAYISALVDQIGINLASEDIWLKKAAGYSDMVDVSEAGASRAFGRLQEKALLMADRYRKRHEVAVAPPVTTGSTTIGRIVR